MPLKQIIIGVLCILSIILSCWSILFSKNQTKPKTPQSQHEPDAFMENVSTTIMNSNGKISLKIDSPKMVHFRYQDSTEIEAPHITIYRDSPEPWHVQSDFAKAIHGIQQIDFWSQVVIYHKNDTANPTTTIHTESLSVFPNQQIAKTNDAITFLQPTTTIHAIGMIANMNNGTIKLLSQTRGEYAPID